MFWMTVGKSHVLKFMRAINIPLLISRVYRRGEYGEYLGVWVPMELPATNFRVKQ